MRVEPLRSSTEGVASIEKDGDEVLTDGDKAEVMTRTRCHARRLSVTDQHDCFDFHDFGLTLWYVYMYVP
jgi:hypothetical protein